MSSSSRGSSSPISPTSRILGLIPARGGSKRIPRKNVVDLAGKPLIQYTIEVARAAVKKGILDRVVVSTDDEEIAQVARKLGADVPFMRPTELANDTATDFDVCSHVVSELTKNGWAPTAIVMLRPTQPLRIVEDIVAVVAKFKEGKYDSIRSLTKAEHHPYWMKKLDGDFAVPLMDLGKPDEKLRSQDLPPVYRLNGVVDIISVKNLGSGVMYGKKMGYILIDTHRSVDLDTPFDLFLAECALKYLSKGQTKKQK